jgi:hypothetical protein
MSAARSGAEDTGVTAGIFQAMESLSAMGYGGSVAKSRLTTSRRLVMGIDG